MINKKVLRLKGFNWRLWAALCLLALVPAVYQTAKTFLISANHPAEAFDLIGQMEWFDLINETLQAFLIVPLYSVLNKIYQRQKERFAGAVFKAGVLVFALYALFSAGVLWHGRALIRVMAAGGAELASVSRYLNLETAAFMVGILVSLVSVVFVVTEKHKNVYLFLLIRTVFSLVSDCLLIPRFPVYGVAVSNILTNTVLAAVSIGLLYAQKQIRVCRWERGDLAVLKEWCKTGAFSGAQQFLDNLIYAVMICRMVNLVEQQGNYWLANNFIWGWLLIPITALAEVIRSDCKRGYAGLDRSRYRLLSGICIALWALSIPAWKPFYRFAEGLANADEVFAITLKLAPFYIFYAAFSIIDNIFVGLGKTAYLMVNSALVNLVYYGAFYGAYLAGLIEFEMDTIILMFGFGMVFHFIVSFVQERVFRKREKKKMQEKAQVPVG